LERHAAELVAYCNEKGQESFRALGAVHGAFANAARNPGPERASAVEDAIGGWRRGGGRVFDSVHKSMLVESFLMAGDVARAQTSLRDALAFVDQSGERFWLPELHRLDGRIALERDDCDEKAAAACFSKAIDVARRQEARLLELRAASNLARLRCNSSAAEGLGAMLEALIAAIDDDDNLKDVRDARALLSTLRESKCDAVTLLPRRRRRRDRARGHDDTARGDPTRFAASGPSVDPFRASSAPAKSG
jgi:hypothetical protein